jgi:hypothetical protein
MTPVSVRQGIIRGNLIELTEPAGLPDGQNVSVVITATASGRKRIVLPPGEGIRTSAGGWSDDPEGLDRFLEEMRRARDADLHRRNFE